jgi:hypothetical protein
MTPTRAIVAMALLCCAWLPGIWWLQRLLPVHAGDALPTAPTVLGGGLLLLLLAALFLSLSLRIEQARLRVAVRAVLRGDSVPDAAPEWRGLLDDLRLAMRRAGLERERLALRAQQAEDALREQGERSLQAARTAQDSLQQVQQEWRRLLPALPSARDGQARLQALRQSAQALDGANEQASRLEGGVERVRGSLRQVQQALGSLGGEVEREFLLRARRLAESLQLLSLNFRLALERLELIPGAQGDALDTVVQDLDPLCVQATALVEALPSADTAGTRAAGLLEPVEQALQALPEGLAQVRESLVQGRAALEPLLGEAQAAASRDLRAVVEQALLEIN